MLAEPKLKTLLGLIEQSTREELVWINGYLAGLVKHSGESVESVKPQVNKITIVYGTDTGNSKKLASDFALKGKRAGVNAKLQSLDQYRLSDLQKEEYFLVVVSTHGDGEPPAAAKKFYDHIHMNALVLNQLHFGVLALGDTSYPLFCKTGEDIDLRLEQLGAKRVLSLKKCDTDYESDANTWFEHALNSLGSTQPAAPPKTETKRKSTGKKIYSGSVISNTNLNGRNSAKQTHHIEIEAGDLDYTPGDSIGIVPHNPPLVVEALFDHLQINRSKKIVYREEEYSLETLFSKKLNIVYLPERVVQKYAVITGQEIPSTRIDLLNLLKIYPLRDSSQLEEIIAILEPIIPRLYSIASSQMAHENEVHITVARKWFTVNDEVGYGLCSDYLTKLKENSALDFYVHRNSQFRLPSSQADVIMIGPGTGIAPFRAFLEERDATGAQGRNWLFFGDQHFESDFLYQTELQNFEKIGVLTRVNVAFSRDQELKVYVQHRMMEHGDELFNWLESGAYLYVCGTLDPMSVDVESALLQIISAHGTKTAEQARAYLEELKETGRYLKDVY